VKGTWILPLFIYFKNDFIVKYKSISVMIKFFDNLKVVTIIPCQFWDNLKHFLICPFFLIYFLNCENFKKLLKV
jgi:hypothetical protein